MWKKEGWVDGEGKVIVSELLNSFCGIFKLMVIVPYFIIRWATVQSLLIDSRISIWIRVHGVQFSLTRLHFQLGWLVAIFSNSQERYSIGKNIHNSHTERHQNLFCAQFQVTSFHKAPTFAITFLRVLKLVCRTKIYIILLFGLNQVISYNCIKQNLPMN